MTTKNAFHWKGQPSTLRVETEKRSYPQKDYYWRKKAGQTGSRQNPDRQWRKRQQEATNHG